MHIYYVSNDADEVLFQELCRFVEDSRPDIIKKAYIEDVDGSVLRVFTTPDGDIVVINDFEEEAVYVNSDIELSELKEKYTILYEEEKKTNKGG